MEMIKLVKKMSHQVIDAFLVICVTDTFACLKKIKMTKNFH